VKDYVLSVQNSYTRGNEEAYVDGLIFSLEKKEEAALYLIERYGADFLMVVFMEPRAREHGIALAHSCQDLKPVMADPKNIEEILNNLLSNAINYSPDGGKVTISAKGIDQSSKSK
jgi:light-regulated signal transduction histidine kinase (bacteriophytochrome)